MTPERTFVDAPPRSRRSNMDRAEQRKLPELYGIAGPILRGGEAFGISVSTTGRIVRQIKRQLTRAIASTI